MLSAWYYWIRCQYFYFILANWYIMNDCEGWCLDFDDGQTKHIDHQLNMHTFLLSRFLFQIKYLHLVSVSSHINIIDIKINTMMKFSLLVSNYRPCLGYRVFKYAHFKCLKLVRDTIVCLMKAMMVTIYVSVNIYVQWQYLSECEIIIILSKERLLPESHRERLSVLIMSSINQNEWLFLSVLN